MICKNCGTEIADKALICFRCGQPTFEAQRKPAPTGGARRSSLLLTVVLILLVLAAVVFGTIETRETPRFVSWGLAAVAAMLLAWRTFVRRRR